MPTYQYECKACGREFEHFQKMNEKPLDFCILCKRKGKVKRLIGTGAGIIFKGSGFYETDYKKKKGAKSEVSHQGEGAKSGHEKADKTAPQTPKKTE